MLAITHVLVVLASIPTPELPSRDGFVGLLVGGGAMLLGAVGFLISKSMSNKERKDEQQ